MKIKPGPQRRLSIEVLNATAGKVRWTCRTCGHRWRQTMYVTPPRVKPRKLWVPEMLVKWARYINDPNARGAIGHCPACDRAWKSKSP